MLDITAVRLRPRPPCLGGGGGVPVLDDTAIDRIVAAVNEAHIPASLKRRSHPLGPYHHGPIDHRDVLNNDLERAGTWYRTGAQMRAGKARDRKRIALIETAARRLRQLLQDVDETDITPEIVPTLDALLEHIKERAPPSDVASSAYMQEMGRRIAGELHLTERSAFEWLAGVQLPKVFTKHFNLEPGYTRDAYANQIKGSYVDFAERSLFELGITFNGKLYSRPAIADALTKVRAGRPRHRNGQSRIK